MMWETRDQYVVTGVVKNLAQRAKLLRAASVAVQEDNHLLDLQPMCHELTAADRVDVRWLFRVQRLDARGGLSVSANRTWMRSKHLRTPIKMKSETRFPEGPRRECGRNALQTPARTRAVSSLFGFTLLVNLDVRKRRH